MKKLRINFIQLSIAVLYVGLFMFTDSCINNNETVVDVDGNVYHTVKIGTQVWMEENLRVTKYSNGDPLPNMSDTTQWDFTPIGAYCNYNNDTSNAITYGRLYNWYAVTDARNIAPKGWHVPSIKELKTLLAFLGGEGEAGGKMKETGTAHWLMPNTGATNESGFSALPGGYRYNRGGSFHTLGSNGHWWTITESFEMYGWSECLYYRFADINRNFNYRTFGFSVRCIKD
jgi:uncharacterized protein (TIGR02145 family)